MKPTSDAIAIAVMAAFLVFVAVNLQAGWVFGVDSLLVGLLVIGWLSSRASLRGLTVRRQLASEAFEGEEVAVTLAVTVHGGRRYFLELHDAVPGLTAAASVIPMCDSSQITAATYRATAQRRGVHSAESVELQSAGLTGLFTSRSRVVARSVLTIFPRYWPLREFPLPGASSEALATPLQARDGLDVAGVREFRDGDSLRHIHWRSTARRGALVVREFERSVDHPLALLLDTSAAAYASPGGEEAFEDLVRAAASIAFAVTQSGREVQLIGASGPALFTATTGWTQALHWLARVQPDGRVSLADLYTVVRPTGAGVIVCSPNVDAIAMLAHRGVALAAVLVDVASYAVTLSTGATPSNPRPNTPGETLLEALGVPSAVLRSGEEVGACLRSLNR